MAHKATPDQEALLSGEQTLAPEKLIDQLPLIQVRVIYLGGHPHKTVRLKGHITIETIKDPDDPEAAPYEIKRQVNEGYTMYDFESQDARGRKRRDQLTTDGKRYQLVEHLGHIRDFYRMKDTDKQPMFRITGSREALGVVQRFLDATKKAVDPDSGQAVLQDMGL